MRRAMLALVLAGSCGPSAHVDTARPYRAERVLPDRNIRVTDTIKHVTTTVTNRQSITTRANRGIPRTTTTEANHTNIGTALSVAKASWYAQGARTANGDRFNPDGLTFAHRTMRFGTRVTFRRGDKQVTAVCTDRGPAVSTGREFDLSRGAFSAIAPLSAGVVAVEWEAQ